MIKIVAGDSIAFDLKRSDKIALDSSWTGLWAITADIGSPPVKTGPMALSEDNMALELRISPAETAGLTVGNWWLFGQVSCDLISFRREALREQMQILPQGIVD